jgi:hypothetical protein
MAHDDDDDNLKAKTNPDWWRQRRRAEVRREIADQELQRLVKLEPRIWDILTAARTQAFSPTYNRLNTYYELRERAAALVGWNVGDEARKRGLATTEAYNKVVNAMSELLPPDIADLVGAGDLTEEEAEELREQERNGN